MTRSRRAFINGNYFEFCIKEGDTYICESHVHKTQKATFCGDRMGYYSPDGHQLILDGSAKFHELFIGNSLEAE
jgi:hypothetical protein